MKLMWKKGDIVRFTKKRIIHAEEGIGNSIPKWNKFVLENINKPLIIKIDSILLEDHPVTMIEEIKGYWDDSVFEPFDNFLDNNNLFVI